jgi:hypothetical protein
MTRIPSERRTASKEPLNFVSLIADEEADGARPSVEVEGEVPGLLR